MITQPGTESSARNVAQKPTSDHAHETAPSPSTSSAVLSELAIAAPLMPSAGKPACPKIKAQFSAVNMLDEDKALARLFGIGPQLAAFGVGGALAQPGEDETAAVAARRAREAGKLNSQVRGDIDRKLRLEQPQRCRFDR